MVSRILCKSNRLIIILFLFGLSCKSAEVSESDLEQLDISKARQHPGIKVIEIPSQGTTEHCIILGGYPELGRTQEDRVFGADKAEKLCNLRFGEMLPGQNHAICPKDNSTNPGIEIYDIQGLGVARNAYEGGRTGTACNGSSQGKKLAKFKGTVTCSATSAIIGGYYISRLLDIGNVPASVLRTVNIKTLREVTDRGLKTPIGKSWAIWDSILRGTASAEIQDLTLTSDRKFVYGALSENPGGESPYPGHNLRSYASFISSPMMKKVLSRGTTSEVLEKKQGLAAYALAQEIKGFSDLIIFDTLLSQQDRLGNIAGRPRYFGLDPASNTYAGEKDKAEADRRFGAGKHVQGLELLLKDNDCGLRGNSTVFLQNNTVGLIGHMSPETYIRLRWLAGELKSGRLAKFLKESALRHDGGTALNRWGNTAIGSIKEGLNRMDKDFYRRCVEGSLKLDLDPAAIARYGYPDQGELRRRCDLVWDPKGAISPGALWTSNGGGTKVVPGPILTGAIDSTGSGANVAPNKCTSQNALSGECISTAACTKKGAGYAHQPGRCLNDPSGIYCCYKL